MLPHEAAYEHNLIGGGKQRPGNRPVADGHHEPKDRIRVGNEANVLHDERGLSRQFRGQECNDGRGVEGVVENDDVRSPNRADKLPSIAGVTGSETEIPGVSR